MGQRSNDSQGKDADTPGSDKPGVSERNNSLILDAIHSTLAGLEFASIEEVQAVMDRVVERYNHAPQDDFAGLSPNQMHQIVSLPFEAPEVLEFEEILPGPPDAPIIRLFEMLIGAFDDKGIKPTATGNLPRSLVRSLAKQFWTEEEHAEMTRFGDLRTETDFWELDVLRNTAQIGGLIRRYRGRFILSRPCRSLLREHGLAGIYTSLLRPYCLEVNWAYIDRFADLDAIQATFAFSMYLLHRFGDTWRENTFYEDAYLRAFPMILEQVSDTPYSTPERTFRSLYTHRFLNRCAKFLGWIDTEKNSNDPMESRFRLRKRPLLDQLVTFHV